MIYQIIKKIDSSPLLQRSIPIIINIGVFLLLWWIFHVSIAIANQYVSDEQVIIKLRTEDILIGSTIYLKTAVDFAILMGLFMRKNRGWKSFVAIETGTGFGNAVGTIVISILWMFTKHIQLLLGVMVIAASFVLIKLAGESVEHLQYWERKKSWEHWIYISFTKFITKLDMLFEQTKIYKVLPDVEISSAQTLSFVPLLFTSFQVPFLLGMDDFAGYVPLFNVVNLYGFGVGVIVAHTLLTTVLFASPSKTIKIIMHPIVSMLGGLFFVLLAFYGFYHGGGILMKEVFDLFLK